MRPHRGSSHNEVASPAGPLAGSSTETATAGRTDVEGVRVPTGHYIDGRRMPSADGRTFEVREAAERMAVSRPTVSGVADTLERRGLVRREGDDRDRRLCRIAPTPAGERLIEAIFPEFNAGESALTAGLDDEERATLARLLRRVVHNAKEQAER